MMIGADRHGVPVERQVEITGEGLEAQVSFVGTSSAFCAFTPNTRLTLAEGNSMTCGDLVEKERIADVSIETYVELSGTSLSSEAGPALWSAIGAATSAIADRNTIVLRKNEPRADVREVDRRQRFPDQKKYGTHMYCVVRRAELLREVSARWPDAVLALAESWLHSEGGIFRCERRAYRFGLWIVSALRATASTYKITYDSLQHTANFGIEETAIDSSPISRGACAFAIPGRVGACRLRWEDAAWNPIVGGFLVAGIGGGNPEA
jgi:hypothetical protein